MLLMYIMLFGLAVGHREVLCGRGAANGKGTLQGVWAEPRALQPSRQRGRRFRKVHPLPPRRLSLNGQRF